MTFTRSTDLSTAKSEWWRYISVFCVGVHVCRVSAELINARLRVQQAETSRVLRQVDGGVVQLRRVRLGELHQDEGQEHGLATFDGFERRGTLLRTLFLDQTIIAANFLHQQLSNK